MANHRQLHTYSLQPSYASASSLSHAPPPKIDLSSLYGSASDHYFPETTSRFLNRDGSHALTNYSPSITSSSSMYHHLLPSTDLAYPQLLQHYQEASTVDPLLPGVKRTSEALYYPTLLSGLNTIGQTEAWYTTDYLTKRLKLENTSHLPIYSQREGDSCKFDHPIWVHEGGILDWKEAPLVSNEEYPERPGEPDCPYYIKTQRCKYGSKCKFNHPAGVENQDALPERPSEHICAFYTKTGKCKFGLACKFHHPKDIQLPSTNQANGSSEGLTSDPEVTNNPHVTFAPALYHNSKGLPVRPGEVDCPFYLKTGSCKYGTTCRYNHPERTASASFFPQTAGLTSPLLSSITANLNLGMVNPVTSLYKTLAQPSLGVLSTNYPQRPGELECDYYMKKGECKFGERCKFHHPADRLNPVSKQASQQQNVKLSLAGYPRREGALNCPYYMKTGTCKYGATCKFDHPPPGEVMTKTTSEADANGGAAETTE